MRANFQGNLSQVLRDDLQRDLQSAGSTIDSLLEHNLSGGVVRNLQGARRELQKVQQSVAAVIAISEMEEMS